MDVKRCDECGRLREGVEQVRDPLSWEVWDEEWLRLLCPPCHQSRADEV